MIVTESCGTREDGVKLYLTMDAVVDENGNPVRDEKGKLVPTGFKIRKLGTKQIYNRAIDVEDADFTYVETNIPIDTKPQKNNNDKNTTH